jgi:hypothetical protein
MKFMDFVRKIFSRKFWIAAAGVTTGVAMIFGATETEIGTVSGAILALGSVASYIVVEGKIDLKRLQSAAEAFIKGEPSNGK